MRLTRVLAAGCIAIAALSGCGGGSAADSQFDTWAQQGLKSVPTTASGASDMLDKYMELSVACAYWSNGKDKNKDEIAEGVAEDARKSGAPDATREVVLKWLDDNC